MATVLRRDGRPGWYAKFSDATGRQVRVKLPAESKTEARRQAFELERKAKRQALGLEAMPGQSSMTLAQLCLWWLDNKCPAASESIERMRLGRHVSAAPLGALTLPRVTTEAIDAALTALEREGTAPATANKLRAVLSTVYTRARKAKVWTGPNPVADVEARKVPKRAYATLRAEEVAVLLPHVESSWRGMVAAALWTGMRKGELCGLLKSDVDLEGRMLTVARSYDGDTTKGGRAAVIPIAEPLVPYLKAAINASPSEWVFPAADGSMRTPECDPQKVLRTALGRAGIIDGWEHVCRRCKAKGRPEHTKRHGDSDARRCENLVGAAVCGMKLWPRALPRPLRFHDLRHSTATLLLRAGVDPYRVQRILRHSSVTVTTGIYGHLVVEDLRAAINTLPAGPTVPAVEVEPLRLASGSTGPISGAEVPRLVPKARHSDGRPSRSTETMRRDGTFQRAGNGIRTHDPCLGNAPSTVGSDSPVLPSAPAQSGDRTVATLATDSGSPRFPAPPLGSGAQPGAQALRAVGGRLLTVREVAAALGVSTAGVYGLVESGALPHLRVSNAIRITEADLAAFVESSRWRP